MKAHLNHDMPIFDVKLMKGHATMLFLLQTAILHFLSQVISLKKEGVGHNPLN